MRDYLQAMQPTWQSSGLGFWTDYIYANGKKIAKVEELDRRVHTSGTFTSSGNELRWDLPVPLNSNGTAYVAQAGDRLCWRQFNEGGAWGGPVATFSNGLNSLNQWTDTAGVLVNQSGTPTQWLYRCADMTVGGAATNATLTGLGLTTDAQTPAGTWHIYYGDMVIAKANGGLLPIITSQMPAPSVGSFQGGNWTGTPTAVAETPWEWLYGIPNYYLDDHLGTSQMELSSGGWPLWQGQFTPFGQELDTQATAMHYKFTGKERDAESGLDYFGARYYASSMGRWMSPDYNGTDDYASPVPYADLSNPQTLNLYAYAGNNPMTNVDPDGHDVHVCVDNGSGGQNCFNATDDQWKQLQQGNGTGVTFNLNNFGSGSISCGGSVCGSAQYFEPGLKDESGGMLMGIAGGMAADFVVGKVVGAIGSMLGRGAGEVAGAGAGKAAGAAVDVTNLSAKITKQMGTRGWTAQEITQTVENGTAHAVTNKATGGAATEFVNPANGKFVVVDNATKQVIQVSGPGFSPNQLMKP